jgi:hypothetical protein
MQVCDLILKQLYLQGAALVVDLARQTRLPFNVIDEGLVFLKDEKCIEVASGELIGRVSYRFNLTDLGRARSREAFEQCRYVGPAPVPLSFVRQCLQQRSRGTAATRILEAFKDLIIGRGCRTGAGGVQREVDLHLWTAGQRQDDDRQRAGRFLNQNGGRCSCLCHSLETASSPRSHNSHGDRNTT